MVAALKKGGHGSLIGRLAALTALPLVSSDGKLPGMQLIYAGRTKNCHPKNAADHATMGDDCGIR